jgi:beta-lactamase regulating signal transducer with metallopeptidase domain
MLLRATVKATSDYIILDFGIPYVTARHLKKRRKVPVIIWNLVHFQDKDHGKGEKK